MPRFAPVALAAIAIVLLIAASITAAGAVIGLQLREAEPQRVSIIDLRESQGIATVGHQLLRLEQVPAEFRTALVLIEDGRFFSHAGVDLRSIFFALRVNLRAGEILYGGSTITQQLTRTLFLTPRQTIARKTVEILLALGIDAVLSKERILELYLNYAEWGPGVYGAAAASSFHFDTPLQQLGTLEQMQLLTVLPNPLVFTPANYDEDSIIQRRFQLIAFHYWMRERYARFGTRLERVR